MPTFDPVVLARHRRQRGSVIIYVLGIILLTSLLLTQFLLRAQGELMVEARAARLAPLRAEAWSVLRASIAVASNFQSQEGALNAPAQDWGDPLAWFDYQPPAGIKTEVSLTDESARLPLRRVDADTLERFLTTIGCGTLDAQDLSTAILGWSREKGAQPGFDPYPYERHEPPLTPPHRPIRSENELRLLDPVRAVLCDNYGIWNALGRRFINQVSLISTQSINLNTATDDVLEALGLDPIQVQAARDSTSEGGFARDLSAFVNTNAMPGTLPPAASTTLLRIHVTTSRGALQFNLEAIVAMQGGRRATGEDHMEESAPRFWTSKSIDSSFQILEVHESHSY